MTNRTNLTPDQNSIEFCDFTEEEYLCLSNSLISNMGPMWECLIREDPVFKAMYDAFGSCVYDLNQFACRSAQQANPCTADCFIDEWLEIFGVLDCLTEEQKTLETVCKLYETRGKFDCEAIQCFAEIEGFEVYECEVLCNNCEPCCSGDPFGDLFLQKQCFTPVYETCENTTSYFDGYLKFSDPPGTSYYEYDPKCDFTSDLNPCVNCCPEESQEINIPTFDPCETFPSVPCDCEQSDRVVGKCRTFADYEKKVARYYPSYNPSSTLIVKIRGRNPCTTGFDTFGSMFVQNDFKICILEKLKPAFLKINYEFEC